MAENKNLIEARAFQVENYLFNPDNLDINLIINEQVSKMQHDVLYHVLEIITKAENDPQRVDLATALDINFAAYEHRQSLVMHEHRVAKKSVEIAREYGLDKCKIDEIYLASLVHDLGKISWPDKYHNDADFIAPVKDYIVMKKHVEIGYHMLKSSFPKSTLDIVLGHHESYDGTGYPQGLKKEEIAIGARILKIADTFDAMMNRSVNKGRSRRESYSEDLAKNIIYDLRESIFDKYLVEAFIATF